MNFSGGAFEGVEDQESPFGYGRGEGVDAGHGDPEWICSKEKPRYDQVFQSLNPVDGKVTGAGTQHSTLALARLLTAHPHLWTTLVVDKALQALLLSTQHCSELTQLYRLLKTDENVVEPGAGDFDKIATALETSSQAMNRIAEFIASNKICDQWFDESSVSIHTVNDTVEDDTSIHNLTAASTNTLGKSSNPDNYNFSKDFDTESYGRVTPNNLEIPKESDSFFSHVLFTIQFIFVLLFNVISICITIQLLFTTTIYILTGELFLEFKAEKEPETWLEKATVVAFGSKEEIIQIRNVFEIFYKHNLLKIFKRVIKYFEDKL